MDIDRLLVGAVLREGKKGLKSVIDKGISTDALTGEGRKIFEFILKFSKEHQQIPSQQVVSEALQMSIQVEENGEPAAYWAERALNRRLSRVLEDTVLDLEPLIQTKPREALSKVEEMMLQLRKERLGGSLIESLPALGPEVIEYYNKRKAGIHGVPLPWGSINDATLGLWPEDLVLFVARLGIGKTWVSLMIAGRAWEHRIKLPDGTERGCRVLYATTEMAKMRIAMRWYAIKLKLPYSGLLKGQLGIHMEKKLEDGVNEFVNSPDFNIVGGDFDFSMDSFDAAIEESNPDIVVIDGAYLLKVPGNTRQERAANVFDELKRINKRRKLPIVATMQFNREVKTNQPKSVAAESIALTDAAGWNADLVYGLIQTEEMRNNHEMKLKPLKIREGSSEEVNCNWNFETMDFSEMKKTQTPVSSMGDAAEGPGADIDGANVPF